MGGSLFIAISKTYRMYGLLFLVQEAKELAEIIDIYAEISMVLQYGSNNNINDLYHIGHKI